MLPLQQPAGCRAVARQPVPQQEVGGKGGEKGREAAAMCCKTSDTNHEGRRQAKQRLASTAKGPKREKQGKPKEKRIGRGKRARKVVHVCKRKREVKKRCLVLVLATAAYAQRCSLFH